MYIVFTLFYMIYTTQNLFDLTISLTEDMKCRANNKDRDSITILSITPD